MPDKPEEKIEELTKKIAELEAANNNTVEEIKADREKRRLLTEERDSLKQALEEATKANVQSVPGDIAEVVKVVLEQKLSERDASSAQSNRIAAVEKFVAENKEFHPENDVTGKLREALDAKLKMFNTNSVFTVEDHLSVIRDAASLLGVNTTPQPSSVPNPYAATTRTSITPNASDDKEVSALEKKLIEKNGWTKERYLSLKAKNPEYMQNLLRLIQA